MDGLACEKNREKVTEKARWVEGKFFNQQSGEKLEKSLMGGPAWARTDTRVLAFSIFQGANSLHSSEFYFASKCQIIHSLLNISYLRKEQRSCYYYVSRSNI